MGGPAPPTLDAICIRPSPSLVCTCEHCSAAVSFLSRFTLGRLICELYLRASSIVLSNSRAPPTLDAICIRPSPSLVCTCEHIERDAWDVGGGFRRAAKLAQN